MTDTNKSVRLVDQVKAGTPGIDPALISGIEVELEAVLGTSRMTVAELMNLQKGATIKLDASLDRDVELRLNGIAIARGELVEIDDHFGVRIVEIIK